MSIELENLENVTASAMGEILECFKDGAKITILVRRPEHEDGSQDFLMTNDDLTKAVSAMEMRLTQGIER
jgi:hypothetical protein